MPISPGATRRSRDAATGRRTSPGGGLQQTWPTCGYRLSGSRGTVRRLAECVGTPDAGLSVRGTAPGGCPSASASRPGVDLSARRRRPAPPGGVALVGRRATPGGAVLPNRHRCRMWTASTSVYGDLSRVGRL